MNERIRQLAEQAREYATTRHPVSNITLSVNSDLFEQKFAELIVRECVTLADTEAERFSNLDQEYCAMAMDNYRELVLKHFGVEE